MSLESAISFFIAMFIFAITPGPGTFAILARAMVYGPKKCIMLALGIMSSDFIYLLLACFGLSAVADNWSEVFVVIRYAGAGYLIYLGYHMFKSLPQAQDNIELGTETQKKNDALSSFGQGFLISASNPKVILFYISFLPTFIDLTVLKTQEVVLISILASTALMFAIMLIALSGARIAKVIKTPKAHRRLNQGAGGIMISAGTYLALNK